MTLSFLTIVTAIVKNYSLILTQRLIMRIKDIILKDKLLKEPKQSPTRVTDMGWTKYIHLGQLNPNIQRDLNGNVIIHR